MEWIKTLFFSEGIAQSIIILASVISLGILLAKIKIFNISFGITWILFVGITFSHFGLSINSHILHFVKEFGLIVFVYSVGLQVGPGFLSSLKKGGLKLNILASYIVLLGVITTLVIYYVTGLPITTMVGILSGAITNTPGLGAAQQTFLDINGVNEPSIALGYALAYPLGVLGIIMSMIAVKAIFRINIDKENQKINELEKENPNIMVRISALVSNPGVYGKSIKEVKEIIEKPFIISRIHLASKEIIITNAEVQLYEGYKLLIVANMKDKEAILSYFGQEAEMSEAEWGLDNSNIVSRRILVTKNNINGKSLSDLKLGKAFGITVTRINRAGVDLLAKPHLQLQIGDKLTIVGSQTGIEGAAIQLGNSMRKLREPNLIAIFFGIGLGILVGSIPFFIPGIPQPIKLGLAGGPLIIAILFSIYGPKYKLVTYTTLSANLMLREIGISLFLACVGLDAGGGFVNTILNGGAIWILYGAIITIVPLIIVAPIGRIFFKLNYFTLMGLMAGSTTDPPALAFSNASSGNDLPAVSYATVYPLTMFLRVLTAQLLILFF